jgi:hypothetical protein
MKWKAWLLLVLIYTILLAFVGFMAMATVNGQENQIKYSFNGTYTGSLFIGGHIYFPKSMADRIKVTGGLIVGETPQEWIIRVTDPQVRIDYLTLTENSFDYGTKTFQAKEYRADVYEPMKPDEIRQQVKVTNNRLQSLQEQVSAIGADVQDLKNRPTSVDQIKAFLKENPAMKLVYLVVGFLVFVTILGWFYGRV